MGWKDGVKMKRRRKGGNEEKEDRGARIRVGGRDGGEGGSSG